MKIRPKKVNIITLGCSKNLVDSEMLTKQLDANQVQIVHNDNSYDARTVIVNTCGFIQDAKEESIETIMQFVQAKNDGLIDNLYVMGCLSERYRKELRTEIPEADEIFGVYDQKMIIESLQLDYKKQLVGEQLTTTPSHYAYLKISEGCDRTCSFCAIPLFKGKHKSVPMDILLKNAQKMADAGVKELILIAQDLTYYGIDLYQTNKLAELVDKLAQIKQFKWIRLHYAYPANFPIELLDVIRRNDNVCKYLDMPVQHIAGNVLRNMRRSHTQSATLSLLKRVRDEIPDLTLRTTLLVGHPGETEAEFEELKEFVSTQRFDRLGVFTYSEEDDTYGKSRFEDSIPQEVKQARADELMEIQAQISFELNQAKIGKTYEVLIDRRESDYFVGRTAYDSPEVDNEVIIHSSGIKLKIGDFYNVKITDSSQYELYGELVG